MKHRKWLLLLLLAGLFSCLFVSAEAADPAIYFGAAQSEGGDTVLGLPVDTVAPYRKDGIRYLFLPAGWDSANLRVCLTDAAEAIIDGVVYVSGQAVALIPGNEYAVKIRKGAAFTMKVVQSANLPAVFLSTESGNIEALKEDKSVKEGGKICIINADGRVEHASKLVYTRTRGNSTSHYPKKAFQIKLSVAASLWGMNADGIWNLLANYPDKSLIRNTLTYAIAEYSGAYAYVPGTQAVDLYVNHGYYGSFLLTEKCEIDINRLDIADIEAETEAINDNSLETYKTFGERLYARNAKKGAQIENDPEDITGGYLVLANSRMYYAHEVSGFVTKRGQAFTVEQPKYASVKQIDYLAELFQKAEDALFGANGTNPETGQAWDEILDKSTFVNRYVLAEVVADDDGQRPYFYKNTDSVDNLLYCAPVWDQDHVLGVSQDRSKSNRFYIMNDDSLPYLWFPQAMKLTDFREEAMRVYREVYAPALRILLGIESDPSGVLKSLDDYALYVRASAEMDNIRWEIAKNRATSFNMRTGVTPAQNIEYIRNYLTKRMKFLDEQWGDGNS